MWPAGLLRVVVSLFAAMVAWAHLGHAGASTPTQPDDPANRPVYVMHITGTIDLGLAPYVERVVAEAEAADAAALVIRIDTPGGRLDAVLQMRDAILGSHVRTVALVDPTAFSAGALVAIAAEEIHVTPGAVIGAATPVLGGTGEVADEKTISAVRATFEATAEERGRDPLVAAAMVDTRVAIDGLVSDGELLTLTATEAEAYGYADGRVTGFDDLLDRLGLADRRVVDTSPGLAERLVQWLTNPVLAGLLLLGGFWLIIGDFLSGGLGVAALAGAGLLATFFWGHRLAGLAGWEDLALIALGVGLLAVEVFVVPGFGVAGVLGLVSIGAGAFLAMISREFDIVTEDDLWRAGWTVGVTLVATVAGVLVLVAVLARRGPPSRLVLATRLGSGETIDRRTSAGWVAWFGADDRLERADRPPPADDGDGSPRSSLVGVVGVATSDLRPGGIAELGGDRIDVVTSGEFVPAGAPIEVVRDEGYRRVVRRLG